MMAATVFTERAMLVIVRARRSSVTSSVPAPGRFSGRASIIASTSWTRRACIRAAQSAAPAPLSSLSSVMPTDYGTSVTGRANG